MPTERKNNHDSAKEQIVPAATRELNNLLQIVSGTVAMLESHWQGPAESAVLFETLRKSVDRAAKVTAQLVEHVGGASEETFSPPKRKERTAEPAPVRSSLRGSPGILVVDDEPMALTLLDQILSDAGYTVVTAQSGFEALDHFEKEPGRFALVLLDLAMPEIDGEVTFTRLRAIDPNVAVLLNTGFVEISRLNRMMANGLAGCLRRPYRIEEVLTKIESVLEKQEHAA